MVFAGSGDLLSYLLCLIVLVGSILLRRSSGLLYAIPFCGWVLSGCGSLQKHPFLSSFLAYLQLFRTVWACDFCLQQTLPSTVRLWSR